MTLARAAKPVEKQSADAVVEQPSRGVTACQAVSAWEREIDERVYRLYGLTPEEIKIVEETSK